ERGEGAFQMLHYWLFFSFLVVLFKTKEDWRRLFWAAAAAAVLMIFYGVVADLGLGHSFISQYVGGAPETIWGKLTIGRFQGSLGNPAYTAPYLLFAMFYLVSLWLGDEQRYKARKLIYLIPLVLFSFFFLNSQTRTTLLGFGFGAIVFLVYLIFSLPRLRLWLGSLLLAAIILGGMGFYFQQSAFVKSLPGARVFDISPETSSLNTRFWTWGSAWRGFLDRPIFGWGPENFSAVFDKYFDPRHFVPGLNTETWFDRAHSAYLDYLAETGILGLGAYLGIFAVFFMLFFKRSKNDWSEAPAAKKEISFFKSREFLGSIERGLMLALVAAYMVQNIAIFEVLPMYINLFFFLGFAFYYFYRAPLNPKP
ncbi:MAG: O-antigen ligase family protein, partial [Patescibacteria group bacterium]